MNKKPMEIINNIFEGLEELRKENKLTKASFCSMLNAYTTTILSYYEDEIENAKT